MKYSAASASLSAGSIWRMAKPNWPVSDGESLPREVAYSPLACICWSLSTWLRYSGPHPGWITSLAAKNVPQPSSTLGRQLYW
ncbi:hypothetical protein D3C77_426330 [compost metagenome]